MNRYQATQFWIWATNTLREFMIKGFVLDGTSSPQPPRDLIEDLAHWHLVALRLLDALLPQLGRDPRLDSP